MTDTMIMVFLGFVATLIAVLTPIIKLTSNIAEIKTILKRFESEYQANHKKLEERVDKHGEELDNLRSEVDTHEVRIMNLEKEN